MVHVHSRYSSRLMCRRGAQAASLSRPRPGAVFLSLALLLTFGLSSALRAEDISITVDNITEYQGTLYWSLYDSEAGYDSQQSPVATGSNRVLGDTLRLTLHDLPAGQYAVRLFHDANDNGEMDSNLLGIPQEGYGFSNNAGSFGPASFADARFAVNANTTITISLR